MEIGNVVTPTAIDYVYAQSMNLEIGKKYLVEKVKFKDKTNEEMIKLKGFQYFVWSGNFRTINKKFKVANKKLIFKIYI